MAIKVFIIGRPGSGKSEASRAIVEFARSKNISTWQVNDYDILYEMFLSDKSNRKFKRVIANENHQFRQIYDRISGFEVTEFEVLNTALKEVAKGVEKMDHVAQLITVEFARNDYEKAFQEFASALLQEAYFLYIDTSVDICVQRVSNRSMFFESPGHHSVPESIIRGYYLGDNKAYMGSRFASDHNILPERVMVIENEDSLENFMNTVQAHTIEIFSAEKELLPDTEKIQLVPSQRLKQKQSMEQT